MLKKTKKKTGFARQQLLLFGVLALVMIAVIGLAVRSQMNSQEAVTNTNSSTSPTPHASSSAAPVATTTPGTTPASKTPTPQATSTPATLAAPVLQKSSGNNGAVPTGAVIEFVCSTKEVQDCSVTLTNKGSGSIVTLAKKTNQSDGRGSYGSTWAWTASAAGTWSIVATASKNGASGQSAEQTLVVQ